MLHILRLSIHIHYMETETEPLSLLTCQGKLSWFRLKGNKSHKCCQVWSGRREKGKERSTHCFRIPPLHKKYQSLLTSQTTVLYFRNNFSLCCTYTSLHHTKYLGFISRFFKIEIINFKNTKNITKLTA